MDAREIESDDKWNEILSRMLPAGSPLPDQDHLDYSIAIEYHGPPVPYAVPRIKPLKFESASTSHYPPNVSWSGRNPATSSVSRTLLEILYSTDRDEEEHASSSQIPMICDTEMDYDGDVSSSRSSLNNSESSPIPVKKRDTWFLWRTGICSRCGIRSRLREREVCIVCEVRYCRNCLIRAMGSMPEGRKCLVCIGHRIDESNRSSLGKSSRMLRNVCSSLQVRQIMKAEKECPVNQLTPEQLFVNGKKLLEKELAEILNCPNPPQDLKPGKYWYDKYSGYWGKVKFVDNC
ncbi:extra-large guanine nucleotide-binding protein 3-like [Impatiens glandulifera]|uniref:extra-large guanine nucleotide-binding protein 3-like n=1 Tax=Impatiens glandulifera TaxID=253017 RepID=UPI001FB10EDD|nr:extra-large guanine nucleotide-binding protein 3-like [Impatiens glandulifera]